MTRLHYTKEQDEWLREHYPAHSRDETARMFAERFGVERTKAALSCRAHQLGLYVAKNSLGTSRTGCARKVMWSKEPEMTAWMLEHDTGSIADTVRAFEERFGFKLVRTQVSCFRQMHGTTVKRGHVTRDLAPVWTESLCSKGYILVKVAERPMKPGTKDNWVPKHVLEWERANGMPLPEGYEVMAGDRDQTNTDPANLVAVPKGVAGIINNMEADYCDADSLRALVSAAMLKSAIRRKEREADRVCAVCGGKFRLRLNQVTTTRTCPDCVAAGRKAPPMKTVKGRGVCKVCGSEFDKLNKNQVRCRECIDRAPKHSAEAQAKRKED